jgi:hypothetical protein
MDHVCITDINEENKSQWVLNNFKMLLVNGLCGNVNKAGVCDVACAYFFICQSAFSDFLGCGRR